MGRRSWCSSEPATTAVPTGCPSHVMSPSSRSTTPPPNAPSGRASTCRARRSTTFASWVSTSNSTTSLVGWPTPGFDEGARSIVVWEGVISYLSESAVDDNFKLLSGICSPGSRLIFTYVDGRALDGSIDFEEARRWKGWVRLNGEPFVFGFHPDRLKFYLAERGFRLDSDRTTAEVARGYRTELGRVEQGSDLYRVAEATRTNQCQR
jgi:hypothetical protein